MVQVEVLVFLGEEGAVWGRGGADGAAYYSELIFMIYWVIIIIFGSFWFLLWCFSRLLRRRQRITRPARKQKPKFRCLIRLNLLLVPPQKLCKYAAHAPNVDLLIVDFFQQDYLRRPVAPRDHVIGELTGHFGSCFYIFGQIFCDTASYFCRGFVIALRINWAGCLCR